MALCIFGGFWLHVFEIRYEGLWLYVFLVASGYGFLKLNMSGYGFMYIWWLLATSFGCLGNLIKYEGLWLYVFLVASG